MSVQADELIRVEARQRLGQADLYGGSLLQVEPGWTRWTFRVLALLLIVAALYGLFGKLPEYAEGPAIVWVERVFVTARSAGTVAAVDVLPGQEVRPGFPLVRYYVDDANSEFHYLRAPRAGRQGRLWTVGDIHISPGQSFAAGDELLALLPLTQDGGDAELSVVAFLPASCLPVLDEAAKLHLELDGYPDVRAELKGNVHIGGEGVDARVARRCLGQDLADSVTMQGPVVLIRASLNRRTFESGGLVYDYRHGMHGTMEVQTRSDNVLFTLLPGLRTLFGDTDG